MLKSIASLFGSLGWMVFRVMMTIASVVGVVYFTITAFQLDTTLGRVLRILGAFTCAAIFVFLVRAREKEDEKPVEDEENRF
jgi:hypothetical protein